MTKNLTAQEKAEKKKARKAGIIAICCVVVMAPVIWFAMEYFAEESMIDYRTTEINGDTLSVILSEKTNSPDRNRGGANDHHDIETRDRHYGYFLELYDSAANKSLDKIEFDSPVWNIQQTPELRIFPNGVIWIVSTSQDLVNDEPGFILKFEIQNNKIIQTDFTLDEKYRIRDMKDNWVIITNGNTSDGINYDPVFGCTYFDLETEKIVVMEPYGSESDEP
ncbi:MAG: hypothetical protein HYZ14_07690 [Bacteroidetes bacterium]|nr:hypothetical protein [Bacteroidota bacterium]